MLKFLYKNNLVLFIIFFWILECPSSLYPAEDISREGNLVLRKSGGLTFEIQEFNLGGRGTIHGAGERIQETTNILLGLSGALGLGIDIYSYGVYGMHSDKAIGLIGLSHLMDLSTWFLGNLSGGVRLNGDGVVDAIMGFGYLYSARSISDLDDSVKNTGTYLFYSLITIDLLRSFSSKSGWFNRVGLKIK